MTDKEKIEKLRRALVGLVGTSETHELREMELSLRVAQAPEADIVPAINAIHVLIELNEDEQ